MKIGVLGAGVAGTAAAWAARRAGADVTVSYDRAGATSLYSGALDLVPWEEKGPDLALDSDVLAFATAVEAWSVGTRSARIATHEGVLRQARGIDSSLLDLAPLAGGTIAVADVAIDGWDARTLVRSLAASSWAVSTKTRFEVAGVTGFADSSESRASWFDVATLHDAPERLARLAESLAASPSKADAWLLGSWLGTTSGIAERLTALVGKPCGETTSPPGGPAGARFEAARDTLLTSLGIHLRHERVQAIARRGARFLPMGAVGGGLTANDTGFDAMVLASGGLIAGGIVFERGEEPSTLPRFTSSVAGDFQIGFDGRLLDHISSLHGIGLAGLGMRALERVGILADGPAARGVPGLFVAGDCVADRPRTVLGAVRAGIAAARRALIR